ncbi:peroxisomal targeting signal 1 receptor [Caerostris darwini]|uniref:Peroxisomal targeting signal 1 receptor n=1 Tax=Caerostris darwini TaxID=1538125 RepID=A0AAV4R586_9ARAC|nr:peroxisomal targeting signal 1 receptor [Caerostris darwini]
MAMRELIDTDCGLTNPLMKVASHFTQDKGQQAVQPSRASASDQLVHEFLLDANQVERNVPETFNMESLLHQMSEIDALYYRTPEVQTENSLTGDNAWIKNLESTEDLAYENNKLNTLDSLDNSWADEYITTSEQDLRNLAVGNDWTQTSDVATSLVESVTDPKITESKFMKFIQKVSEQEINLDEIQNNSTNFAVQDIWSEDFASPWPCNVAEGLDVAWHSTAQENREFKTFTQTEDEKQEEQKCDADFWDNLQKEWEKMAKDETNDHPWLNDYERIDPFKDYAYAKENPFIDHNEPFEEGLEMLKKGDLPSAVLLFEAAVQKNPNHVEAWQYLGTSQAKNEQDRAAIAATRRCLELDPSNLIALMSLAVSYTNESMPVQACDTLVQWLYHNPKYSHLVKPEMLDKSLTLTSVLPSEKHKATQDIYIEAARMSPDEPDPDVQNGLGVLFNLSGDYDKAVDCFKAALQVKPEDSLLWNRLGATLANSNRSGEAFEAYYRALELYPGLIRSRFNLGVSCINLNAIKEAVEHFLLALNLQNAGRGPQGLRSKAAMSTSIWSTLRTAMSLLRRPDLYDAVDRKDLDLLNKEFGMEV